MSESHEYSHALTELAQAAGISVDWTDSHGRAQRVKNEETLRAVLHALELPAATLPQIRDSAARLSEEYAAPPSFILGEVGTPVSVPGARATRFELIHEAGKTCTLLAQNTDDGSTQLPAINKPGYYRLRAHSREWTLAIAPSHCPSLSDLMQTATPRAWGLAVQLYSLRRATSASTVPATGIGDFTALAQLANAAAEQGAAALAMSPVHAMFAADPNHYSPYAPSNRLFLNSLYADPALLFGKAAVMTALQALELNEEAGRIDRLALIDWPAVTALRMKLMRRLYDDFQTSPAHTTLPADFQAFRRAGGPALEQHACFEALHAHHLSLTHSSYDWRQWPEAYRHPTSPSVRAYAQTHAHEVSFHIFLQWLAAKGLQHAQQTARSAGMPIGLINDLAIGSDPSGSHAWSHQAEILKGLASGAPPDTGNPLGQCWGLTAFSPRTLRRQGYTAFLEMLQAAFAYTGGIRIDHILGLTRLWLVPDGASPAQGAYLRYPLKDMLRLITLEAWRHQALVIGENLGTVPADFNAHLKQSGMLGMNILWFQRDEGTADTAPFQAPSSWPTTAIAMTSTHDLPTVAGWWQGRDISWRARLNLLAPHETKAGLQEQREKDRTALWQALQQAHCTAATACSEPPNEPPIQAVVQFVAATPAPLMLISTEDLLGLAEQPNLPTTLDEHPNWRQRLDTSVTQLFDQEDVQQRVTALTQGRERKK